MKPSQHQQLKWELFRERFGIADRFPPREQRQEKPIGDILKKIAREEPMQSEALPQQLLDGWAGVTGPQLVKHTCPAYLKNGILYVYADHPGWLSELKRLPKNHLLKRISSICPSSGITELRFQMDPSIQTQKSRPYPAGKNSAAQTKKPTDSL